AFVPMGVLQKKLDLVGRANVLFVANAKSTLQADLHQQLTLDDWGLRFRSPKDRAEAFFRLLKGEGDEPPQLKPARWQGRLPEALAESVKKAGGGLTKQDLIDYYEMNRDYYVLESKRL